MVTVVDAANLLKDYASEDFLAERGLALGDDDHRPLVELLVDQIEFADVVILNKLDLATPDELSAARSIIRSLNAGARVVETTEACVPLDQILGYRSVQLRGGARSSHLVQGAERLQEPYSGDRGIRHREPHLPGARAVRSGEAPRLLQ